MTDWLRLVGYSIVSGAILIGLLLWGWWEWARRKTRAFQISDSKIKSIQDSQRGRRPMWPPAESRKRER